ncbi:MAG: hypothetical protein EA383_13155 [Spirochaetaceae bacterium]|nr:MAG: hypothetical protein EA383_13155 [Spirochaetaceae bacterium]
MHTGRLRGLRAQHILFHVALMSVWTIFAGNARLDTVLLGLAVTLVPVILFRHTYRIVATSRLFASLHRLPKFLLIVGTSMVLASVRIAVLAFRPGVSVHSRIITYEPEIHDRLAIVLLACAVTLTPGTIVVDRDDRRLYVHVLAQKGTTNEEVRKGIERLEAPLKAALREQAT